MSNNELLLALSEMMDNKLKPLNEKINKIEADVNHGFNKVSIILESEIRPDISYLLKITFLQLNVTRRPCWKLRI